MATFVIVGDRDRGPTQLMALDLLEDCLEQDPDKFEFHRFEAPSRAVAQILRDLWTGFISDKEQFIQDLCDTLGYECRKKP